MEATRNEMFTLGAIFATLAFMGVARLMMDHYQRKIDWLEMRLAGKQREVEELSAPPADDRATWRNPAPYGDLPLDSGVDLVTFDALTGFTPAPAQPDPATADALRKSAVAVDAMRTNAHNWHDLADTLQRRLDAERAECAHWRDVAERAQAEAADVRATACQLQTAYQVAQGQHTARTQQMLQAACNQFIAPLMHDN